jgi:hypothetical protein
MSRGSVVANMKKVIIALCCCLLMFSLKADEAARRARFEVRLVLHDEASDSEQLSFNQQTLYVQKQALIDSSAIAVATSAVNTATGTPEIKLVFTDAGAVCFAKATHEHARERLAFVIDGKISSAPVVRDGLKGDVVVIAGSFTAAEAAALAERLNEAARSLPKAGPRFKARIVCFNGKINSGSSCATFNFQPDGALQTTNDLTCGFPGHVSKIECAFVEQRGGKDAYRFTRHFPADMAAPNISIKTIEFSYTRTVVFEDEHQVVVIEPVTN